MFYIILYIQQKRLELQTNFLTILNTEMTGK